MNDITTADKEIIVHMGLPKCGSSTLQYFFLSHAEDIFIGPQHILSRTNLLEASKLIRDSILRTPEEAIDIEYIRH